MTAMSADLKTAITTAVNAHVADVGAQAKSVLNAVESDFAAVNTAATPEIEKMKADIIAALGDVKADTSSLVSKIMSVPHVGVVLSVVAAVGIAAAGVSHFVFHLAF
jgi:hypothetical protein